MIRFLTVIPSADYAITHNLTPFISMQNHYSLVYREEEREMFPTLKHFGVGSIPWSPLARGFLTRPLGKQTDRSKEDVMINGYMQTEGNHKVVGRVDEIAKKKGVTMAQIAVAWAMSRDGKSIYLFPLHHHLDPSLIDVLGKVSRLPSLEQLH